jgi:XTP/dITP diphosphohydrolase
MTPGEGLHHLRQTMAVLRGPGGCAWDLEQDHRSLVPYLIEESAELVDAIESGTRADLQEELGDVLYQVFFHADIAVTDSDAPFDIDDIAWATAEKMRSRHPHVFADTEVADVEEIRRNWEALKRQEKPNRRSITDAVPHSLDPLARAQGLLARAKRQGIALADSSSTLSEGEALDEEALGEALLLLVRKASERGLSADRALRGALRRLETEITSAE